MKRFFFVTLCLSVLMLLSGCIVYQVSALSDYNGPIYEPTEKCYVYRTSLESKFNEIVTRYDVYMLGDSHVATSGSYESIEAAYDCMTVGATSVLVLDRGVVASSSTYVPGTTNYNYNAFTNQMTSTTTPGYYISQNTSAFVVVFFGKELLYSGTSYTMKDYKSWKKRNGVTACSGC
ncbi:MAG: hypothetical protein MJZ05_13455 [Fibrobacter sp.]|nr:hypothetical protein [Fibrobacter sp.]